MKRALSFVLLLAAGLLSGFRPSFATWWASRAFFWGRSAMKAELNADGCLIVTPETPGEAWGLRVWNERYLPANPRHGDPMYRPTTLLINAYKPDTYLKDLK